MLIVCAYCAYCVCLLCACCVVHSAASSHEPMTPFFAANPLSLLVDLFASGIHRVALFPDSHELVSTVSQSDVINWMVGTKQDHKGPHRTGQDRTGPDRTAARRSAAQHMGTGTGTGARDGSNHTITKRNRTEQDRTGQNRTRQGRSGQDRTGTERHLKQNT